MARKLFADENLEEEMETKVVATELPRVKQIVRFLSTVNTEIYDSIQSVDEEVSAWLANGYKLFATHYIGGDIGKAYGILYILLKE